VLLCFLRQPTKLVDTGDDLRMKRPQASEEMTRSGSSPVAFLPFAKGRQRRWWPGSCLRADGAEPIHQQVVDEFVLLVELVQTEHGQVGNVKAFTGNVGGSRCLM
jgi:hypothetical protein